MKKSDNEDVELNEVPYMKGNQLIYCQYSITEGRYVMPKRRTFWKAFSDWWNRKGSR